MPRTPYLTAPVPTAGMPGGIPYIIGNEAAERFSFYGMKTILVVFMTRYLMDSSGRLAPMSDEDAKAYYHLFVASAYFFPIFGAILSDAWWGKYTTIMRLSVVYCLGHLALAIDATQVGLFTGLLLIAVGSGGIKPCVSAHVGDQFGRTNVALQTKGFGWFYLSINFGSFISTALTPWLLEEFPGWLEENGWGPSLAFLGPLERLGPHVAFGLPGLLMLIATIVFWMGRYKFVHIPARGWDSVRMSFAGEGRDALLRLAPVFLCISIFWSVYDQTGSSWVLQAEQMDLRFLGLTWLPAQVQVVNPLLILVMIPLLTYVVYPAIHTFYPLTPLRKVTLGLFLAAAASAIIALAQQRIDAGGTPSVGWQFAAYFVMTIAEVMVWVTCLEFSYTQAPQAMKSFVMSVALLSIFLGNLLVTAVNKLIQNADGTVRITDTQYHWLFTGMVLAAAVASISIARRYREKSYLQDEQHPEPAHDPAVPA